MNKKRVLFLINKLEIGGAQRVFLSDFTHLDKKGFEVYFAVLFGGQHDQNEELLKEIPRQKFFYVKAGGLFDFSACLRFRKFINEHNINIVYSTLNESNIFSRFAKVFTPKLKIFIREANIADKKTLSFKILDLMFNFLVEKIVCVSNGVQVSLLAYQKVYRNKMIVLMNGVNIPISQKVYPTDFKLPLKVLNVGGLTPKKGHRNLILACKEVLNKHPNSITLNIYGGDYGGGKEKEKLNSLIMGLGLNEVIRINDFVDKSNLSLAYLEADLFVLSSLYEGCPNVLLEAMAHGLAVVSTKVSGAVDIIEQNTGLLAEVDDVHSLANQIMKILENPQLMAVMGDKSRQKIAREYGFSSHFDQLLKILYWG